MNGPEHYQAAERLTVGVEDLNVDQRIALAQVHATLALAAATALTDAGDALPTGDGGMPTDDYAAWIRVAAVPRPGGAA